MTFAKMKCSLDIQELFALKLIPGIGDGSIQKIMRSGKSINQLMDAEEDELKSYIARNKAAIAIQALKREFDHFREKAGSDISRLHSEGIKITTSVSDNYPPYFHLIKDKPLFLYYRGNEKLLKELTSIAIVGTRECSSHGFSVAKQLARAFSRKGYCIISGLAEGIDTAAHEGALLEQGKTVAVLIDVGEILPKSNSELAEEIVENGGLLIAETKPHSKVVGGLFVKRDRLQSAYSLGVVPVETSINGGTMHTVRYARDQGRLLLGADFSSRVDYDYDSKQYQGIAHLLKEGALTVLNQAIVGAVLSDHLPSKKRELAELLENYTLQTELFS